MHTLYQWIEKKKKESDSSTYLYDQGQSRAYKDLQTSLPDIITTIQGEMIALVGEDEVIEEMECDGYDFAEIIGHNQEKSRLRTAINNYFEKRV